MGYTLVEGARGFEFTTSPISAENPLSRREMDVLRLYVQGLQHTEIGSRLDISSSTVKNHLTHLTGKLGIGLGDWGQERFTLLYEVLSRGIIDPRKMLPENYNEQGALHRTPLSPHELDVLHSFLLKKPRDQVHGVDPSVTISASTVKNHLAKIYKKLGVSTNIQAFGVALNAHLGGIDLTKESNGERFGEYDLPEGYFLVEDLQEREEGEKQLEQEAHEEGDEYILLAKEPHEIERFLQILADGGVAVIAYDPYAGNVESRSRRTPTLLQDVKNLFLFAAFDPNDIEKIIQLAQSQSRLLHDILAKVEDSLYDRSIGPKFLQAIGNNNSLFVHVLNGVDKLSDEQRIILEKLVTLPGITIPENLRRFLSPNRRNVQTG